MEITKLNSRFGSKKIVLRDSLHDLPLRNSICMPQKGGRLRLINSHQQFLIISDAPSSVFNVNLGVSVRTCSLWSGV